MMGKGVSVAGADREEAWFNSGSFWVTARQDLRAPVTEVHTLGRLVS